MNEFKDQIYYRDERIEGIGPWAWPIGDTGLWDGPKNDWETSHSQKIFSLLRKTDTVIQAGGGCGMYPRLLANRFNWVYTFEPHWLSFFCLTQNCQISNVFKFQALLGNKTKQASLMVPDTTNLGTNKVYEMEGDHGSIPMITIDLLNLSSCDLIWIDVEGYERRVIDGALKTIEKFKPVVVLECGYENGLPTLMDSIGYDYKESSVADIIYVPRNIT